MIITCPNCGTKFNLPDDKVQPGAQLRCSVCKLVFGIPDAKGHMPGQAPGQEKTSPPSAAFASPQDDGEHFDDTAVGPNTPASDTPSSSDTPNFEDTDAGDHDDPAEPMSDTALGLDGDFAARRKTRKRKSHKGLLVSIVLLLVMVGGAAAAWHFKGDVIRGYIPFLNAQPETAGQDMTSKISLRGVRQYSIANEKLGVLSVIEGKAVNGFTEPRELIKVEATLFDKDNNALSTRQQVAGPLVSLFQLQVLSEKDLEQALNNKFDILSHNTNVAPEGEVPFMIVFYGAPETATEFVVKVVDAKLPPK